MASANSSIFHDASARALTWNAGTLNPNPNASSRITATFRVEAPIAQSVRVLTNTIASDWDSPAPAVSRIVTTTLVQPKPPSTNPFDKSTSYTLQSAGEVTGPWTNNPSGVFSGTYPSFQVSAPVVTNVPTLYYRLLHK